MTTTYEYTIHEAADHGVEVGEGNVAADNADQAATAIAAMYGYTAVMARTDGAYDAGCHTTAVPAIIYLEAS